MNEVIQKLSKNLPWIENGVCLLTLHGSRAYGTNTENSDFDFKGITIPTKNYFFSCTQNLNKLN